MISSLSLLSGCASFYDISTNNNTKYVKPFSIEQTFDITGRFFIKKANKNDYGNFTWRMTRTNEELNFNSPIGQTFARITIESGIATLTARGKSYTGKSLDLMMQDQLGFILPINYLHYWVQGVSLPQIPITNDLPDGFIQLGWRIQYLKWSNSIHPQIIQCTKDDLVIKLLVKW